MEYSGSDLAVSGRERYRDVSRGRSPDHWPQKFEQNRRLDSHDNQNRYPEDDPVEGDHYRVYERHKSEQNRGKNEGRARRQAPEHHLSEVRTKYPEECLAGRNKYTEAEPRYNQDLALTMKERAHRDDPSDRDRTRRKDRDQEKGRERRRKGDKAQYRDKSQDKLNRDPSRDRLRHKEVDMGQNGHRHRSRDLDVDLEIDKRGRRERERDEERHWSRDRSKGQELDHPSSRTRCSEERVENADYSNRQRLHSNDEVFEEPRSRSHHKGQTLGHRGMRKGPCVSLCYASSLAPCWVNWWRGFEPLYTLSLFLDSLPCGLLGESSDQYITVHMISFLSLHGTNPYCNLNGS